MESVRVRLKKAMEIRGLRQADLVERYGFGTSTISQYLSGRNNPKQKAIYTLAAALDVRPDWLMGLDVPMETTEKADLSKKELGIIEQYRRLDDYDKGRLAAYLDMFLQDTKYNG